MSPAKKDRSHKLVEPRPIRNPLVRAIVLGFSTGLGTGYLPVAPGTWGSLVGIPFGIWLLSLDPLWALVACALFTLPAAWAADRAGHHYGDRDSQRITIDEVLGQGITILGCHSYLVSQNLSATQIPWQLVLLAFGLFRLFDIVKPFPARTFDRQANGFGVIADDIIAGLYAAVLLKFIIRMWFTTKT